MELPDTIIVEQTLNWLNEGKSIFFVTVVKTAGSSPRPVGSIMSINQDGAFVGSVSSGCIEEMLREKLLQNADSIKFPASFTFGGSKEEAERFQLPCGAIVELVVESINEKTDFDKIQMSLKNGKTVLRTLDFATGETNICPTEKIELINYSSGKLKRVFGSTWQLLLIGAVDISFYLAQMAKTLNFRVTICEPRIEHAECWKLDKALLDKRMPDDIISSLSGINRCAIIALTHDPRIDDLAMLEALPSDAFYIGALGSRKNNEKRKERLRSLGTSDHNINKLHGPVGMDIDSKTPAEIAISILAELIAVRNNIKNSQADKFTNIVS